MEPGLVVETLKKTIETLVAIKFKEENESHRVTHMWKHLGFMKIFTR